MEQEMDYETNQALIFMPSIKKALEIFDAIISLFRFQYKQNILE